MRSATLLAIACLSLLPACQRGPDYGQAANPFPVAGAEYDRLYNATRRVLKARGFTIARANYRFGVIQTEPRTANTLAEPIRNNNTGLRQQTRATLRHLRRTVTVTVEPADADNPSTTQPADPDSDRDAAPTPPTIATTRPATGDYQLRVRVRVEARQHPTRRLINATGSRVFSTLERVPERWQQRGIERTYWQTIGDDDKLENRLIHDIVRRSFDVTTDGTDDTP